MSEDFNAKTSILDSRIIYTLHKCSLQTSISRVACSWWGCHRLRV